MWDTKREDTTLLSATWENSGRKEEEWMSKPKDWLARRATDGYPLH